jgi:hypothetical protein
MTIKEWNNFLNARILAAEAGQPTPIEELKPLLESAQEAGLIPSEHALAFNRVHANHKEVHMKYLKVLKYYSSK